MRESSGKGVGSLTGAVGGRVGTTVGRVGVSAGKTSSFAVCVLSLRMANATLSSISETNTN